MASNTNKKVIFENWAKFTTCVSKIDKTQVDNSKDIDVVMPMYNLAIFWRSPTMLLINCKINLILTWAVNCVLVSTVNTN